MNNEWFDIAWINFTKAVLHGQIVDVQGNEVKVEKVLTDQQREQLYDLNEKHKAAMDELLRRFATTLDPTPPAES